MTAAASRNTWRGSGFLKHPRRASSEVSSVLDTYFHQPSSRCPEAAGAVSDSGRVDSVGKRLNSCVRWIVHLCLRGSTFIGRPCCSASTRSHGDFASDKRGVQANGAIQVKSQLSWRSASTSDVRRLSQDPCRSLAAISAERGMARAFSPSSWRLSMTRVPVADPLGWRHIYSPAVVVRSSSGSGRAGDAH